MKEDIIEVKEKLEDHEERIKKLEKLVKGKGKGVVIKRKSIPSHLTYLRSEGFFDQPRTVKEIIGKLAQEGYHYRQGSLSHPLQRIVRKGVLGRIKTKERKWAYCKR